MDRAVNSRIMRATNRGLVFKKLVVEPGISRPRLAQSLNLTKMSISKIVAELLQRGLIQEEEKIISGEAHKNPVSLNLASGCPRIIGIQIQRKYCKAVLCDFRLNILDGRQVNFERKISLKRLKEALLSMTEELLAAGNVLGIGIGCVGPVDVEKGVIRNPPNFGDVKDFPVAQFMEEAFGLPAVLEHHYNCAALAEQYFGIGRGVRNFLYVGITRGVGMGAVVNGRLYSSFLGNVPEIGHISVDVHGRRCRCGGRGCLEQYVSVDVMERELEKLTGEKRPFREFCAMADRPEVMGYFDKIMEYLKTVLAGSVNLFRPELIIIGDEGKYFPDACVKALEDGVAKSHLYQDWWKVRVRKTDMDRDLLMASPAVGIMEKVFAGELLFDNMEE